MKHIAQYLQDDPYGRAIVYYGISTFLELCVEPFYIYSQKRSFFKLRLVAETVATLTKSSMTYYLLDSAYVPIQLAFAYGQVIFSFKQVLKMTK